ncbi:MAG: DUF1489 domain-containing protein [Alphaproteobacteria bacterium]
MPLNLIKLCVGISDIKHLKTVQAQRRRAAKRKFSRHITRNWPRRAEEILTQKGSLYWVIKGVIRVRQPIIGFDELEDDEGRPTCGIRLASQLVPVMPYPFRPFQGWRYLENKDAPPDLRSAKGDIAKIPADLLAELRSLGLM